MNNKSTNRAVTLAVSIKQVSAIGSSISNLSLEYTYNLQLFVKLILSMVVLHTTVTKYHRPKLKKKRWIMNEVQKRNGLFRLDI